MPPKIKIPYVLYDVQREIVDAYEGKVKNKRGTDYRFFVAIFGRQSGKSFLARYMVVDRAINHNETCMWVSRANTAARSHWTILKDEIIKSGYPVKTINEQAKEIRFPGGGMIRFRSAAEPENIRGDGFQFIVLDEAAFYPKGTYIWHSIIQPMITATRGKVLITTTPRGRNWIYDMYLKGLDENEPNYLSWHMPSTSSPYQDREMLEDIRRSIPRLSWLEEYEAQFVVEGSSIFASVEAAAVETPLDYPPIEMLKDGYFIAGQDFGFANDYNVFTVVYVPNDGGTARQVYIDRWSDTGTTRNFQRIWDNVQRWQPRYLCLERNGLGAPMFSLFKEKASEYIDPHATEFRVGDTKIIAYMMDNSNKRKFVEELAAAIEYGRLTIIADKYEVGRIQMNEMSTYERQSSRTGQDVTYNAQSGYFDDVVSALYLAASKMPKPARIRFDFSDDEIHTPTSRSRLLRGQGKSLKRVLNASSH